MYGIKHKYVTIVKLDISLLVSSNAYSLYTQVQFCIQPLNTSMLFVYLFIYL
jgi:hypothetical protein